jgi:hypothetical protein
MLAEMDASGAVKTAGATYDLQTGVIDFFG